MKASRLRSLAWLLALVVASTALAQELRERPVSVRWQGGVPRISFSARDLVDAGARAQLESGLRAEFVVTAQAFRAHGGSPLATRRFACSVYWDVWEEVYWLSLGRRREPVQRLDDVVSRCLAVHDLAIGHAEDYASRSGQGIYFAVRAEFNPVSSRQCRALLRQGSSGEALGPVVVNLVRRQICRAERAVTFRSPQQTVP